MEWLVLIPGLAVLALVPGAEVLHSMAERPQREALEAMWSGEQACGLSVVEPGRRLAGQLGGTRVEARLRRAGSLRALVALRISPVPVSAERWGFRLPAGWVQQGAALCCWDRPDPALFQERLSEGIALAEQLSAETVRPWFEMARRHRMQLRGGVGHWAERARLFARGTVDGVQVEARLVPYLERLRLEIRARVPGGLPGKLRVYPRRARVVIRQHRPPIPLRDPILDDRVQAFGWLERYGRACLTRDGVRGRLLELLMQNPGSAIVDDTVIVRAAQDPRAAPEPLVCDAVGLARAMAPPHRC